MFTKTISSYRPHFNQPTFVKPLAGLAAKWVRKASHALQVRRERRALAALDPRLLKDVGLSQSTAYREAHRNFWDLPPDDRGRIERVRRFRTRD